MSSARFKNSLKKTSRTFVTLLPVILGMLLLTNLALAALPARVAKDWFSGCDALDALLGTTFGSVAAGHPMVSYLLGGELLALGVNLVAVTALIVSWVTVGIVQLPAEAMLLGTRFALVRNVTAFLTSMLIAAVCVWTLRLFA